MIKYWGGKIFRIPNEIIGISSPSPWKSQNVKIWRFNNKTSLPTITGLLHTQYTQCENPKANATTNIIVLFANRVLYAIL